MYSYNISAVADNRAFLNTCAIIEAGLSDYIKKPLLTDVDGSLIQIYDTPDGEVRVFNDYEVDAVFVDSAVDLKKLRLNGQ